MEPIGFDVDALRPHFSGTSFTRGTGYARGGRVRSPRWDPETHTLTASVVGSGGLYTCRACFEPGIAGGPEFIDGRCSCPIGYNCKHVVALLIAASQTPPRSTTRSSNPARDAAATPPGVSPWERSLRALAAAGATPATGTPLAIELRLVMSQYSQSTPRLMARLMRPGARGGWVNGSLDWGALDSWRVTEARLRDDHVAFARDLYAVASSDFSQRVYSYSYRSERSLDLSGCESPQLWPLLQRAAGLGIPLIHKRGALGELGPTLTGELVIDVARAHSGDFEVRPALGLDGDSAGELMPVAFLGRSAHGVACIDRTDLQSERDVDRWRLTLVRLHRPAVPELVRMLDSAESQHIPTHDIDRFARELSPALGRIARLVSSDGSFTPLRVSEPALVLVARHTPGPLLTVAWEWEYAVGDVVERVPIAHPDDGLGFRDRHSERERSQTLTIEEPALQTVGLLDDRRRVRAVPGAVLTGLDALEMATEVLPRLARGAAVRVEIEGMAPDYRDVGSSLSVGLSTAEVAGDRDWFDLGITICVGDRELPFTPVFAALARGESHMLLDDGAYFSLQDPRLQALRNLIEEARALVEPAPGGRLRISRYQSSLWSELTEIGVVSAQSERWQRAVRRLAEFDDAAVIALPKGLKADLRPYQREGFAWLARLWELELGGILADDMGLGKTLQALALMCHARERDSARGPFLILAPTSVVSNWVAEAARFAPELRVEPIVDTLAKSGRRIEDLAKADAVVTSYTLFRLDADAYRQLPWAGLILDEAQFVKNHRGKTYRCARELPVPFTLAITGTPMENNLMELWALLSLTSPGLFPDPQRFAEHYARPIERGRDEQALERLRRRIRPLITRRTKELVAADLPPKQEQTLDITLSARHRKLYDTHLQRERQRVLALLDDFEHNRIAILRSITRLRQLSLHPALLDDAHARVPCAKLDALIDQLDDVVGSGHRALVFSQFTSFLSLARERLTEAGIGWSYLDGSTRRRDAVIEHFRTGADPVFLISLKAGGVGLNLTEADYCFLLDPWWNPAAEAQAIDRTHRIGQTSRVMVYRLIARGTIEEKVRQLAERKAQLFTGVMDEGDLFSGAITAQDIRGLLT
jgi:superfamily II DNA or RNA helicase